MPLKENDVTGQVVKVHLAEYASLRGENLALLRWREGIVLSSLIFCGALFSFAFVKGAGGLSASNVPALAPLFFVTPIGFLMGNLWMLNTLRMRRIGEYLDEVLTPKINTLFSGKRSESLPLTSPQRVFGWHSSDYHKRRLLQRWFLGGASYFVGFLGPPIAAQMLLGRFYGQGLLNGLSGLAFIGNCGISFVMLMVYVCYTVSKLKSFDIKAFLSSVRCRWWPFRRGS
jgi:hypothetical protein